MPTLPITLPANPGGGDLPVKTAEDVRAVYPRAMRGPAENAPVREALVAGQLETNLAYQERSAYAAVQADPTRATGIYLEGHASDREIFRQSGEDEEALRARMLGTPAIVTPQTIVATANDILAAYTTSEVRVFESILDRMFVEDGNPLDGWHSFIGAPPQYPDRHYDLRPNTEPTGSWVFDDALGRFFVMLVPELDSFDASHAYVFDGTVDIATTGAQAPWIHNGTNTGGSEASGAVATFVTVGLGLAADVYQAVVNSIQAIKGHSVRWKLIADPAL